MDDMQVYIANLGKYNEGELVGAWFTFPIDFEEVKEKIGLNDEYEEYAIHDYEYPLRLTNTLPLANSIDYGKWYRNYPKNYNRSYLLCSLIFQALKTKRNIKRDIIIHSDCDDMYDVAHYYIEETGALGEVTS